MRGAWLFAACLLTGLLSAGRASAEPLPGSKSALVVCPGDCPAAETVVAELQRIGALPALEVVGTAEVATHGSDLHVVLRSREGSVLGMRDVAAPRDCVDKARLAAVVIAAWAGEWAQTVLQQRALDRKPEAAPARPLPEPAKPAPPARRGFHGELGVAGSGAYDGDAGTWVVGLQGGVGRGPLSLVALVEGQGERERSLGPGQAGYRVVRAGVGAGVRKAWSRLFIDFLLVPEAMWLSLQGKGLPTVRRANAWGLALDGRVRLGALWGRVAPFVQAGGTFSLLRERLSLDDRADAITLSRGDLMVGAGMLVLFPE